MISIIPIEYTDIGSGIDESDIAGISLSADDIDALMASAQEIIQR